jgi:hypothetical protein
MSLFAAPPAPGGRLVETALDGQLGGPLYRL